MKKIIILFFTISFIGSVFSQTNYFNNYYNPNNTGSMSGAIYPINGGYVCAGLMRDTFYWKNNIVLLKLDSVGNLLVFKEIKLDSSHYYIGAWGGGGFAKCSKW